MKRSHYIIFSLFFVQPACSNDVSSVGVPPACNIISPADSSTVSFGDTVTVEVDASVEGGGELSVEFYVNDRWWHTDSSAPFQYTLDGIPYRIGNHTLKAVAVTGRDAKTVDSLNLSIVSSSTPVYGARVRISYQHDEGAYTQGLVYDGVHFYEGTGQWDQSSIRRVEVMTGEVLKIRQIPNAYFGEGITIIGHDLFQLTWNSGRGFIYNSVDFDSLGTFAYDGEGWGLTNDGTWLIMSDGTSVIRYLQPGTSTVAGILEVTENGSPVSYLNELEYVEGDIFANVWYDNRIARISPDDGEVVGWIDLQSLAAAHRTQGVLNGIAYDSFSRMLFVTGKNWDKVYRIELTH